MSKLTLIGAGPGDPDLLTIKGMNALLKADAVLYDALANPDLLGYCRPDCERIYVGKKPGIHAYQQILINDLIVECGRRLKHVVRLKGGDPFVFGRGYEEILHARMHGMETEVIPGITSALSVPAACGIPVTHRGTNESFWVITGTTSNLQVSSDIHLAARSSATILILMGMSHLDQITTIFRKDRKSDEPIAIIQNGTRSDQKMVSGTLATIQQKVKEEGIGSPAVIVIGEVVRLGDLHTRSFAEISRLYSLKENG